MKVLLLSALAASITSLAACQSTSAPVAENTQTYELTGTQARATVEVPVNDTAQAPYALQGTESRDAAVPMGMGYQAR